MSWIECSIISYQRGSAGAITVRLYPEKNPSMVLSWGAHKALGFPERIEILLDVENRRFGFKAVTDYGYSVSRVSQSRSVQIAAGGLRNRCKDYGISWTKTPVTIYLNPEPCGVLTAAFPCEE